MRVTAFCGSFRKDGNTSRALKRVLAGAESQGADTRMVYLGDYRITPCCGCRVCEQTDACVITQDDVSLLHDEILRTDAIVLGTPTFYGDITSVFKLFVDRCYPFMKILRYDPETRQLAFGSILEKTKPGILVAISGGMGPEVFDSHRKVASLCFNDINAYIMQEILVPYTTWDPVDENHVAWEQAYRAGVDLVRRIRSGDHPVVRNEL